MGYNGKEGEFMLERKIYQQFLAWKENMNKKLVLSNEKRTINVLK